MGRPTNALLYHTRLQCLWIFQLTCHVLLVIWLRVVNRSIALGPGTPGTFLQWSDRIQHAVVCWCIWASNIPSLSFHIYIVRSLPNGHPALRRISAVLPRSFDRLPPSQPEVWWHGACWCDRSSGKGSKNDRQLRQGLRLSQKAQQWHGMIIGIECRW